MGLGITAWFPVGILPKTNRKRYEKYFSELLGVVPHWNPSFYSDEHGFRLKLVPFEEDVYGSWQDGKLCITAKTNSAGPGYHAYLVDILDRLGIKPTAVEDEAGYYETRDYAALQNEMAHWLKSVSYAIVGIMDKDDASNLAVSLGVDWLPVNNLKNTACCPLGFFGKEFFQKAQDGADVTSEFFLWWNREQDAVFFKNTATYLILCEVNWLKPALENEKITITAALECLEKAYRINPDLWYPAAEWLELAELMDNASLQEELKARFGDVCKATLGYKRDKITSNVHGWRVTHSGKMHLDFESDSDVYWDGKRTIRLTSFTVDFNEDVQNKSKSLLEDATATEPRYEPFHLNDEKVVAKIMHSQDEENGQSLWITSFIAAHENNLLFITLLYEDEADRSWAIDVCNSVTR